MGEEKADCRCSKSINIFGIPKKNSPHIVDKRQIENFNFCESLKLIKNGSI
jgi:hypothetical protein